MDTQELMNTLKRCKNDDLLKLETGDGKLVLRFDGDASRTFKLRLIHEEYESPVPPSIDYPVELKVPSTLIKESLTDCRLYGENLRFRTDENYLHICSSTASGVFGDTHIKYLHGENINHSVQAGYSIEKLNEIYRASKLSKECTLYLGNDLPLQVKFNIGLNDGVLVFLLAPRIEND